MKYTVFFISVVILSLVASASLLRGFIDLLRIRKLIKSWHQTSGAVIENLERDSEAYSPIVRFIAIDGSEAQFTERSSSYPPRYKAGEQVKILYNPQNFNEARLYKTTFEMYWSAIISFGLGVMFLLLLIFSAVIYVVILYTMPDEIQN